MNDINDCTHMGDAQLQLALRGLRRDIEPARDVWPGIAARLSPQFPHVPVQSSGASAKVTPIWPWALAASLLLALGVFVQPGPQAARPLAVADTSSNPSKTAELPVQAQVMGLHYQAALRELNTTGLPASWQPGLQALDHSAAQIQAALRKNPDSPWLMGQLRQIYLRKIALSRRALLA